MSYNSYSKTFGKIMRVAELENNHPITEAMSLKLTTKQIKDFLHGYFKFRLDVNNMGSYSMSRKRNRVNCIQNVMEFLDKCKYEETDRESWMQVLESYIK